MEHRGRGCSSAWLGVPRATLFEMDTALQELGRAVPRPRSITGSWRIIVAARWPCRFTRVIPPARKPRAADWAVAWWGRTWALVSLSRRRSHILVGLRNFGASFVPLRFDHFTKVPADGV